MEDIDKIQLGDKQIEFVPMTWGTQKKVFRLVTKAMGAWADTKGMLQKIIVSLIGDKDKLSLKSALDIIDEVPDLLTEIIALGLGTEVSVVENATGPEVVVALQIIIEQNDVVAQMADLKKAFALLSPPAASKGSGIDGKEVVTS